MPSKKTLFNVILDAAQDKDPAFNELVASILKKHHLVAPKKPVRDPYYLSYQLLASAPALQWLREGEVWSPGDAEAHVVNNKSDVQTTLFFDRKRLALAQIRQLKDELTNSIGGTSRRFPTLEKAQAEWEKMLLKFRIKPAPKAPPRRAQKTDTREASLMAAFAANPDDANALRVLADLWQERGEPRGEFVNLCLLKKPTQEQIDRRETLKASLGGKLVGPAREFIYRYEFGTNGLVTEAAVQPEKLVAGIDAISALNPRLELTISALKNAKVAQALGALSLAAFETVCLPALNDKQLTTIAPALKGVRRLKMTCRGYADTNFTPAGFRELAEKLANLEHLTLDHYRSEPTGAHEAARPLLPPVAEYVEVVTTHPAFAKLKSVSIAGAKAASLKAIKSLREVIVAEE